MAPAITSVALRAAPLLDATEYITLPLPVSGTGLVTVTHEGRPVTVQVQPACAVTLTMKPLPCHGNAGVLGGEIVAPTHGPAACDTECVAPAMTIKALRAGPVLGATV